MMGTGKSTVGRLVAAALGWSFVDSDGQVEARTGRTVRQIFETDGETAYRRLESAALADALAADEPAVVAAAGGVVLDETNRGLLAAEELVVWLHAAPEVLAERVGGGDHRPLLADDPLGTLRRLAAERESLYREVADVEIDVATLTPRAVAERIVALVHARGSSASSSTARP